MFQSYLNFIKNTMDIMYKGNIGSLSEYVYVVFGLMAILVSCLLLIGFVSLVSSGFFLIYKKIKKVRNKKIREIIEKAKIRVIEEMKEKLCFYQEKTTKYRKELENLNKREQSSQISEEIESKIQIELKLQMIEKSDKEIKTCQKAIKEVEDLANEYIIKCNNTALIFRLFGEALVKDVSKQKVIAAIVYILIITFLYLPVIFPLTLMLIDFVFN